MLWRRSTCVRSGIQPLVTADARLLEPLEPDLGRDQAQQPQKLNDCEDKDTPGHLCILHIHVVPEWAA